MNLSDSNIRKRRAAGVIVALALVVLTSGPALAQPPVPVRYSTRALAMGGAMLLSAGPIEAGYFNPGALTQSKGLHIYVPMAQLSFTQDFWDLANFMKDNADNFDSATFTNLFNTDQAAAIAFVNDLASYGNRWYTMNVDPMVGVQIGSLSFSAYSVSRINLRPVAPQLALPAIPATPVIEAQAAADLVLNGALGLQLGPFLHGGIGVRYLQRQRSAPFNLDPDDMEKVGEFTTKLDDQTTWLDDPPTALQIDAGGMFTLGKAFAVGGVIRGLVSSASDEFNMDWKPEISGGVRLRPLEIMMGIPLVLIKDITLEADIKDLTGVHKQDFIERIQIGAEVKMPLIALRGGLNQGQLSLGAGIHFLIVDLSAAISTISEFEPLATGELVPVEKRLITVAVGIGW